MLRPASAAQAPAAAQGVAGRAHAKGAHPTALDHLGKDFLSYREGGPGGAEAGGAGSAED